jgi:hypothetical protein
MLLVAAGMLMTGKLEVTELQILMKPTSQWQEKRLKSAWRKRRTKMGFESRNRPKE